MRSDKSALKAAMDVFDTLSNLPAARRRDHALLQTLDSEARALVEGMLTSLEHDGADWLDQPVWSHLPDGFAGDSEQSAFDTDLSGRQFGNWQAIEPVGHGGMSVVWKGKRADGLFEREVAIKLLRTRPGHPLEPEYLLREVQILARLQHANIAGLLDGGIDGDQPWLVMEYVEGRPITEFCRERGLGIADRLALFEQVIEAVAHAHSRLVVHCDIKPSNVLVTEEGQVKLVDFGISNLLSQASREVSQATEGVYCTPGYAAPEQLAGESASTAQDVFALGAVLYELLCGQRIRDMGMATCLMRGLRPDRTIPPPSVKVSSAPGVRTLRLDRDLDAICLRALADEPGQRYASASLMGEDIRRWHEHLPVAAAKGSGTYRVAKWMRRNQLPAALGGLVAIALVAGTVVSLNQAMRANAEAKLARSVQDFMLEMFNEVDPWRNQQRAVTINEVIDTAVARLPERLEGHATQRAQVSDHLGDILQRLGRYDESLELHLSAAETWGLRSRPGLARQAKVSAAKAALTGYRLEQAIELLDEVIAAAPWPPVDSASVRARVYRAELMTRSGEHEAQAELLDSILANESIVEQLGGGRLLGEVYLVAAESAENRADYEEAIRRAETSRDHFRGVYGDHHPSVGKALSYIATTRYAQGRYAEALEAMNQTLAIDREFLGEDHPQTLWSRYTLSRILVDYGRLHEAGQKLETIAATLLEHYGQGDPRLSMTYANLAKVHRGLGDLEAAANWFERGFPIIAEHEPEHPKFGVYQAQYALVLVEMNRLTEAGPLLDSGMALLTEKLGDDHPETNMGRLYQAGFLLASGEAEEAGRLAELAFGQLQASLDSGSHQLGLAHRMLGDTLAARGDAEQARVHWQQSLAILDRLEHRGQSRFELDQLMAQLDSPTGRLGD